MRSPFAVALCAGLLAGATAGHADPKPPVADGDWQGNLATPDGRSLRLALHVTRDATGGWRPRLSASIRARAAWQPPG